MSRRAERSQPMRRPRAAACVAAFLSVALTAALPGQTRYARYIGVEQGLVPAFVGSLAQDHDDLLWVGTSSGLYRYDGVDMRRWAPELLRSWVSVVAVAPGGGLTVLEEERGGVFEIVPDGARPVPGPTGEPLQGVHYLVFDREGALWALRRDSVLHRDVRGRWSAVRSADLDGTWLHRVRVAPGRGVFVLTDRNVWHLTGTAPPRRVAALDQPRDALALSDGRLVVLTFHGALFEIRDSQPVEVFDLPARGIALAERHGTLWMSFDRYLVSLAPGTAPEVLGPEDGIPGGGPLLVDHEGSLWLGSFSGLLQFPEPDTRVWNERHGLPSAHARFLAKIGDTVWVNTWSGTAVIARLGETWHAAPNQRWSSILRLFVGPDGALRSGSGNPFPGLIQVRGGNVRRRYREPVLLYAFAAKADGSEWYGTQAGLLVATSADAAPERAAGLPFSSDQVVIHGVLHDASDRTWLASERRICWARDVRPLAVAQAVWTCDELPSGQHVTGLIQGPDGAPWTALRTGGVWRYRNGAWVALGGREFAGLTALGLVSSPSGGIWVVSSVTAARVIEDPAAPDGWRVVERLSGWHGLRNPATEHILEEADGTLWVTVADGVARIPAAARQAPPSPRRVVLVDASVDDDRVPLRDGLALPHNRNRLTLRFAAPSYRDPRLLRYQVRLSAREPWTMVSGPPVFRWVDLRPGRYEAQVRASLDGQTWTPDPARFAFRVLPPWYLTAWAVALFVAAAAVVGGLAYRARVAFLLGLERQRTRIALDLHDEMGSGLGSIGILSGVLASEGRDGPHRRKLATQIAEISQDLGTALSDIVWSLDPRSSTLADVAGRLAEHGSRLFAGDSAHFAARLPEAWPATPLDFPVRRGVLLIGLEALHNAARHAQARHVTLAMHQADGRWQLVVEDDGCGLSSAARRGEGGGVGLRSLRQRAAEIGGRIAWADRPGGGTRVTLDFSLSGRRLAPRRR